MRCCVRVPRAPTEGFSPKGARRCTPSASISDGPGGRLLVAAMALGSLTPTSPRRVIWPSSQTGGPMADYEYLTYETFDDGTIARIMLNRLKSRNAQNRGLLVELDDAFMRAEADDTVRVVILGGNGPMFSSGHDLGTPEMLAERLGGEREHPTMTTYGGTREGAEQLMLQEWHFFFNNTR